MEEIRKGDFSREKIRKLVKKNLKEIDQLERKDVMVRERGKKIWVTILERGRGETRERTKIFYLF